MKFIIVFLLSLVFSITDIEKQLINEINSNPSSTWKAVEYPEDVITTEKMKARLIKPEVWKARQPRAKNLIGRLVEADSSFDARSVWGKLILPVRNQWECGSCWAFAVAETTGDRIGIEKGTSQGDFSPQDLVSCDTDDEGCGGGYVDKSWNWVLTHGITTEECMPYTAELGLALPCLPLCLNLSQIERVKATKVYPVPYASMQDELQKNGPYEVAFTVYLDFEFYQSGVYKKWDSPLNIEMGGHAVLVVGWGVDGTTPYWLIQNSWGDTWGEQGFFRIVRGNDECGIEDDGYAGIFN